MPSAFCPCWSATLRLMASRHASTANGTQAKALGVSDVAFHKKSCLRIEAMVKSRWVYRKLRNFRAGIEANNLLFEAGVWPGTLHLSRAGAFHLIRLVLGCRLQPGSQ